MRTANLKEMRLAVFMCLLCCSFAFDTCINANGGKLIQVPDKLEVNPGEDAIITCTITDYNIKGVTLRKRFKKILYVSDNFSKDDGYKDRLLHSGNKSNFSVTLKNLTINDSDIYLCDTLTSQDTEICSEGTLLIVRPPVAHKDMQQGCGKDVHITYLVTISAMLLLFVAAVMYMKLKKSKELNVNHNTYVDMTQTIRRNTMGNSFVYSRTQNGAFST